MNNVHYVCYVQKYLYSLGNFDKIEGIEKPGLTGFLVQQ
ncbi:hypothetical protein ADIS_3496 [Lunatimonas lonarensis]|uniref:Uncharacterized protein n=1 Tax=Lunatimonas lonarensis TaxID=1232681 RepID=R7ZPM7_9BACT|nr:hypothetical protein ADIS_3496 [Lunatimonas lonarensis]